jgi:hypothetical protein
MLVINYPAQSDHLGIVVDLDMESFFSQCFLIWQLDLQEI